MLTDKQLNVIRKFLENHTFTFKGELLYDIPQISEFDFKIDVKGYRKMISVGEYYDYLIVGVTITKLHDPISEMILGDMYGDNTELFKKNLLFLYHKLNLYIIDKLRIFDAEVRITIDEFKVLTKDNNNEIESDVNEQTTIKKTKMSNLAIRTVVIDILRTLKLNETGEYYLPSEDGDEYNFKNLPFSFSVELHLFKDDTIENFIIDGNWVNGEDIVEIIITYNPTNLKKNLYNIVGELNEIVTHELTHGKQDSRGDIYENNKNLTPFEYYSQPKEVEAQKAGFKRLSKLRQEPYENIVKEWFDTHQKIHNLSENEVKGILKLLS